MTTLHESEIICGNCHNKVTIQEVMSTNTRGSPDLDLRPPEMKRSTIDYWVYCCPKCGYCAQNLTFPPRSANIISTPTYRQQLENQASPILSNYFLCEALLLNPEVEMSRIIWCYIHGAWAADDEENEAIAISCRTAAIQKIIQLHKLQGKFTQDLETDQLILVDLLRRVKKYEQAEQLTTQIDLHDKPVAMQQVLNFQRRLIEQKDTQNHSIQEAQDGI